MPFSLKRLRTECNEVIDSEPKTQTGIELSLLHEILAMIQTPNIDNTISPDQLISLMQAWIWKCSRILHKGVVKGGEDGSGLKSEVFLVGSALCGVLRKFAFWHRLPTLHDCLGIHSKRILVHGPDCSVYKWTELCDTIAALQLEMPSMIYACQIEDSNSDLVALYTCDANILVACMHLMRHIGFFLTHSFSHDKMQNAQDPSIEHMHMQSDKTLIVRKESIYLQVAAIHASLSLLFATTQAERVVHEHPETIELHSHHREASLDDFYQNSMLADLAPGFIMQYRSRYAHLFHSISQVIYFHYPQYIRKKQIPLADITARNAAHISVLPLLQQLFPGVPVFYEHTGGCCLHEHAKHEWSWLMLSGFVLLVRRDGKMFAAEDLRSLALMLGN